jgi:RNA polymerase sigma factor (sigma-70 family)
MAAGQLTALLHQIRRLAGARPAGDDADAELLRRFVADRDEQAFTTLVWRHAPLVLGTCRRVLVREVDAEDAFQAVFLVLARKAASVRRGQSLGAWLYRVAYHVAVRARADLARRRRHEREAADVRRTDEQTDDVWRQLRPVLDEELSRLPAKYRDALALCYFEGKTHSEAARELNCPTGSMSWRLARGRELLRRRLVRRGVTLSAGGLAGLLADQGKAAASALLVMPTVTAAVRFAAGAAASGRAVAWANTVLHAMVAGRIKIALGLVLCLGLAVAGADVLSSSTRGDEGPPRTGGEPVTARSVADPPQPNGSTQVRTDRYGDPLPPGAIRRLGSVHFRQHNTACIRISPDGKTLVTASWGRDQKVCVWDVATGKLLRRLPGSLDEIAVALAPDGQTLAVPRGEVVTLWDLASGKAIREFHGDKRGLNGCAFSMDGKLLAAGGLDEVIHLWVVATGKELARLPWPRLSVSTVLLAFTPDRKGLIAAQGSGDSKVHVWDLASRKERWELTNEGIDHLGGISLSPDGRTLAAGGRLNVDLSDGAIPLWDLATGKLIRKFRTGDRGVMSVAFSPDGKTLAWCGYDAAPHWWVGTLDVATGKQLHHTRGVATFPQALAFSSDGKMLFTAGGPIQRWDVATGKEIDPVEDQADEVWRLALSPDGRVLAAGSRIVCLWDPATGKELHRLEPPTGGPLMDVAFSPDGQTVATVSRTGWLCLWQVATGRKLGSVRVPRSASTRGSSGWEDFESVMFSPDGRTIATGAGGRILLIQEAPLAVRRRFQGSASGEDLVVQSVGFLPDGRTLGGALAAWGLDATVRFWDVATGKPLPHLYAHLKGQPAHFEQLMRNLCSARLALSADGRMWTVNRQTAISVWETASGKERLRLAGHKEPVTTCAFSPDGRTLASAGWDGTIRLWDLTNGKELACLTGHRGTANCLAFSPDGKRLFSGSSDTCVLIWEVAGIIHRPVPAAPNLAPTELESLWRDLARIDAARAYCAVNRLAASPGPAVQLLGHHLEPVRPVDRGLLAKLLEELDDRRFAVRTKAAQQLADLGEQAEPALRRALHAQPTAAVRHEVERILERLPVPGPAELQQLRAMEVLERIGTAEGKRLLGELARGVPETRVTREAKLTLKRLDRRTAASPRP